MAEKLKDHQAGKAAIYIEPKFENRFIVQFPEEFNIESWAVQFMNRPKFNFKKKKWENIKIKFIDPIAPSTSERLMELIKSYSAGLCLKKKKFEIKIETLDPTGVPIETWLISECKIIEVDFGNWEYHEIKNGDTIIHPTMTIKPKSCELI